MKASRAQSAAQRIHRSAPNAEFSDTFRNIWDHFNNEDNMEAYNITQCHLTYHVNLLREAYMNGSTTPLQGIKVLEIGCGSTSPANKKGAMEYWYPILAENLTALGASVTGIDRLANPAANYTHIQADISDKNTQNFISKSRWDIVVATWLTNGGLHFGSQENFIMAPDKQAESVVQECFGKAYAPNQLWIVSDGKRSTPDVPKRFLGTKWVLDYYLTF